jgi:hypothetical protein
VKPPLRSRVIRFAVIAVAVFIVILLILVALGVLVFPSASAKVVEVTGVHWTIVQGTTENGIGWFGPSQFNYTTVDGYPINVSVGGTVSIPWSFSNYDVVNRTIIGVVVASPFQFVRSSPTFPVSVPSGTDDAFLSVTIQVPSTAGASLDVYLTVYAH